MKKKLFLLMLCVGVVSLFTIGCGKEEKTITSPQNTEIVEITETNAMPETENNINKEVDEVTEIATEVMEESTEVTESTETETSQNINENTNVANNTNWQNYTVIINGVDITLPCTYEQIHEVTGLTMKSSEEKSYLENGYYTSVNLRDQDDKTRMRIDVLNDSGEDALYTDCKVTRITQTDYANDGDVSYQVVFPGGFVAGQELTPEELTNIMGNDVEPREYVDGDYWTKTYKWMANERWTTANYYEIVIKQNIVDSLALDNR